MSIIFMFLPLLIMAVVFGLYIWQAVWVALDSRKKGEEYWWLWTIVALFTFPVGVIVYALVTKSNTDRCNNCGKEVPSNINSCPYCGEMCGQICSNCGQKVQSGWKYCPNCTTALPEEIAFAPKVKNNRVVIIIASLFVLVFLFIVGLFVAVSVYSFRTTTSTTEEVTYSDSGMVFLKEDFDTPYTKIKTYTLSQGGAYSITYKGEGNGGYVVIRLYGSQGNLLAETERLEGKDIEGVIKSGIVSDRTVKVDIEFNEYEGYFYLSQ